MSSEIVFKMSESALLAILLLQVTLGYSFPNSDVQWSKLPESRTLNHEYFSEFNVADLNPFKWYNPSQEDTVVSKIDELYKIVECLAVNEREKCRKILEESRGSFGDKKKKRVQTKTSETPSTTGTIPGTTARINQANGDKETTTQKSQIAHDNEN